MVRVRFGWLSKVQLELGAVRIRDGLCSVWVRSGFVVVPLNEKHLLINKLGVFDSQLSWRSVCGVSCRVP